MDNSTFSGFKQFTNETLTRVVDKISITKGSQFNFPTAMYKKNRLSQFKAARLYYNKERQLVGIEFIPELEDGAFKLVLSAEGRYGAFIVAKSFFFMHDLDAKRYARRYNYKKLNLEELGAGRPGTMFAIDLKEKEEKDGL